MNGTYDPRTREHVVIVHVTQVTWHSRMAYGHGTDERGSPCSFVGDPRMLGDIADLLRDGEPDVPAMVPTWALFGGPEA